MIFIVDVNRFNKRKDTVPAFLVTLHKPLRPNQHESWPPPVRDFEIMFSFKRIPDDEREKYMDVERYNLILSFPDEVTREFWLVFDGDDPLAARPDVIFRVQDDVNDSLRGQCRPMTNTFHNGLYVQAFSSS